MSNKINLIIVTPGFAASEADTSCLPALQMFLKSLKALNCFSMHVIALQYPYIKAQYNWFGIPVTSIGGKNKKYFSKIKTLASAWRHLKQLKHSNEKTVVLSFFATDGALVAGYFCKLHHLKHYCWIIGQDALRKNKYIPLISKETIWMAMSAFLKKTAERNFKITVNTVLPNGLNLASIPQFESTEKIYDFICVGSLIPLKQVDWVIRLMHDLAKEHIKGNCIIIGDGPGRRSLELEIKKLNLQDHVKLLGLLSHEEVIRLMFKSKILLHPSAYEGFSTVCLEALYAACHVVTTCNPLSEINEQMHPVDDYENFAATAKNLLSQPLSFKSYASYTTEKTAEQFLQIIIKK